MRPGPHPKGELMRRRILNASAKVFLEYGYNGASSKMVARLAGVSNGSPFFLYGNKEGVLLELVKLVYAEQFRMTDELIGKDAVLHKLVSLCNGSRLESDKICALIQGKTGVGKTYLINYILHQYDFSGWAICQASCYQSEMNTAGIQRTSRGRGLRRS